MEKYVVEKKIGSGSYGNVFVVHSKLDASKRYVMKRVPLSGMSAKEKRGAKQEVLLLQTLQHPNIVSYRDSFLDNNDRDLCIVMTYCQGGDLSSRIKAYKGQPIPEEQIIQWFLQIALALEFIHTRKVLHRDLKTQNVFLTKSGHIKLGDFGIARVLNKTMDMAQTSIGTPLYMSPECCNNKPYSFKSDVWSIGCCLYEMMTGRHPFNARDLQGLFMKIVRGVYSPIPTNYSSRLRQIIEKTLNTSPNKRPTMTALLQTPFLSKHIIDFCQKSEALSRQNTNVSSSIDHERIELKNLQIQVADLGISIGTPSTPRILESPSPTPRTIAKQAPPPAKPTAPEKPKPSINPYKEPVKASPIEPKQQPLDPRLVPPPKDPIKKQVDVRKAEAKMKFLEREKLRMAEVLQKLQKEREDKRVQHEERMKKLAKENQQRMDDIKRLQAEKQLRANQQRQKPVSNPLVSNNPSPPQPSKGSPGTKRSPSLKLDQPPVIGKDVKVVANNVPKPSPPVFKGDYKMQQQAIQDKKDKEDKLERIKKEKEEWTEKVREYKKKVEDLEQQKQAQDKVISAKDKVLQAKEQKRVAEQQAKEQELLKARQNYYNDKVNAKLPQDKQRVPYNPNPQPYTGEEEQERELDADDESDSDEELITKYQAMMLQNTRKIEHLKQSICKAKIGEPEEVASDSELSDDDDFDDDDYLNGENEDNEAREDENEDEITDDEHVHVGGRLTDRIQFLKHKCESIFGLDLFDKLYESSKNAEIQQKEKRIVETEMQKEKRLERVLGSRFLSKLEYCHLIDELLFVESNLEPL